MKIFIILAEGFEEIEAVTVIDILRRAGVDAGFVALNNDIHVKGTHGIEIKADNTFTNTNFDEGDMIVLPGGLIGMQNLDASAELENIILEYNKLGKWLAAICASPTVFAHKGILKNKKATIYSGMGEGLEGVKWIPDSVVVDGNIITSKGPGTAVEFALKILEISTDVETRKEVGKGLLIEK